MHFEFTEEQRLLKESVDRFVASRYAAAKRQDYAGAPEGWSRTVWQEMADLGLLALPFSDEDGGLNAGPIELMIVMEAFGRGPVLEPYLSTVVLGGTILRHASDAVLRQRLVAEIAAGRMVLGFAHSERAARYDLSDVQTTAKRSAGGWTIDGPKAFVLHGDSADRLIVSARVGGPRRSSAGIGLFLVDPQSAGVTLHPYATQDGRRAADITFANAEAEAVLREADGHAAIAEAADRAIAALAAETVGALGEMQTLTLEYLRTRKQFGVAIGSFQALQHRAADMLVSLELARSMALYGAMMATSADPSARGDAMSAVKVQIGKSAKLVAEQAVQLHGGIGVTSEYALGNYFKRVAVNELLFGDVEHHLGLLAADDRTLDAA